MQAADPDAADPGAINPEQAADPAQFAGPHAADPAQAANPPQQAELAIPAAARDEPAAENEVRFKNLSVFWTGCRSAICFVKLCKKNYQAEKDTKPEKRFIFYLNKLTPHFSRYLVITMY